MLSCLQVGITLGKHALYLPSMRGGPTGGTWDKMLEVSGGKEVMTHH